MKTTFSICSGSAEGHSATFTTQQLRQQSSRLSSLSWFVCIFNGIQKTKQTWNHFTPCKHTTYFQSLFKTMPNKPPKKALSVGPFVPKILHYIHIST